MLQKWERWRWRRQDQFWLVWNCCVSLAAASDICENIHIPEKVLDFYILFYFIVFIHFIYFLYLINSVQFTNTAAEEQSKRCPSMYQHKPLKDINHFTNRFLNILTSLNHKHKHLHLIIAFMDQSMDSVTSVCITSSETVLCSHRRKNNRQTIVRICKNLLK